MNKVLKEGWKMFEEQTIFIIVIYSQQSLTNFHGLRFRFNSLHVSAVASFCL